MNYFPLCIKTDHSLLKSMIKIDELIKFSLANNITCCGICDYNLFGAVEFYYKCKRNNIKPIIGLTIYLENHPIYLYAQNYSGYQNLLKLNSLIQKQEMNIKELEKYSLNVLCVIPFNSNSLYMVLAKIFNKVFISYTSFYEKNNALVITSDILYLNDVMALSLEDTQYLNYLNMIDEGNTITNYKFQNYEKNYIIKKIDEEDRNTTYKFSELINLEIPKDKVYIPKYKENEDSYNYLHALTHKGLLKRLNNNQDSKYLQRLNYELNVIKEMGFVDYFLIVYDYILYAKKNDILVGPGRGSAAGSLVAYTLGITDIDPLKYDLLFERFLNKDRITMPDIDVDFEDTKRNLVIEYLKDRYGKNNVANIMTYSTLSAKQVIRDVAKVLEIDEINLNKLLKYIDAKTLLIDNYRYSKDLQIMLKNNNKLQKLYKIAMKLEGMKRQISTHAAGVIISSEKIDNLIPMVINNDNILTGCTMEYLEDLGLIKMDLLAIKNLRIIKDMLDLIKKNNKIDIKLNNIPLNDSKTLEMFKEGNTVGIFQFESEGMKNFLQKLKPSSFEDIIAAIALYRPGPMENIDEFIKRKNDKRKVTYLHEDLEDILSNTYGIIVYQEQIMQILVKMGNFTFSKADNIRRAMSKKKKDVMEASKNEFINNALKNNYRKTVAEEVYDLIMKFANYGFNKSHSVAYALIGYQMAYLKAHFETIFYANLLNMSISSEIKTMEYLSVLKKANIKIHHPSINNSLDIYRIENNNLLLPLGVIKGIGTTVVSDILKIRGNEKFKDFFDFVCRTHNSSVTKKVIESLILAGAFSEFGINKQTLINNIDSALDYAELTKDIDTPLILKPTLEYSEEYSELELINKEKEVLGFYVTNHPSSKYHTGIVKLDQVEKYFDKFIKCVVLVNRIVSIKTKNSKDMSFITAEDETTSLDFVIFPNKNSLLTKFKKDDLISVTGKVEKRIDKYQIVVSTIEKIK